MENNRGSFSSNLGFVLAAMGSAIGLGNLWGFPYKMGANGGFPFQGELSAKLTERSYC